MIISNPFDDFIWATGAVVWGLVALAFVWLLLEILWGLVCSISHTCFIVRVLRDAPETQPDLRWRKQLRCVLANWWTLVGHRDGYHTFYLEGHTWWNVGRMTK
jgi:hypothetical protein